MYLACILDKVLRMNKRPLEIEIERKVHNNNEKKIVNIAFTFLATLHMKKILGPGDLHPTLPHLQIIVIQ